MTTNQIKWFEASEGKRHNLEMERQGSRKLGQDYEIGSRQAGAAESQAAASHRQAGASESNAVTNRINAATRQAELGEAARHNYAMEDIGYTTADYPYFEWAQGGQDYMAARAEQSRAGAKESRARANESGSRKQLLEKQTFGQTLQNVFTIGTLPSNILRSNLKPVVDAGSVLNLIK